MLTLLALSRTSPTCGFVFTCEKSRISIWNEMTSLFLLDRSEIATMTNDFTFREIDNVFRDIGGVVGNALQIT